jgi:biotin operon repressor
LADPDLIIAPQVVSVQLALEPAYNAMCSLFALALAEQYSGYGEWVVKTAKALPQERAYKNRLLCDALDTLFLAYKNDKTWPDFPAYIEELSQEDPYWLRDIMLDNIAHYARNNMPDFKLDQERFLNELDYYIGIFQNYITPQHYEIDRTLFADAQTLLNDPPAMLDAYIEHLTVMWNDVLAPEWGRNLPLLQESINAFERLDYSGMTAYEAVRTVAGRDVRGSGGWDRKLKGIQRMIFVPSAHAAPYMCKFGVGDTIRIIFGARVPESVRGGSPALSRSELLVRLNALSDETRLRILELLSQHGEMCAQDIIEVLGLSQSSVSRHLNQLVATGYIIERRREVAKCYTLNLDRFDNTLGALGRFLRSR